MTPSAPIGGTCSPRFQGVREAFAANFAAGCEVDASFAATVDGQLVVDLWGGFFDAARTRRGRSDTIVNVFSTTKAMTALCAHVLVERGALDLAAPVSRYWPEFAQGGKERLPVHLLLSHRARRRGAVVGAGERERIPRDDLRLPRRRAGAAPHREDAGRVLPRRDRDAARRRFRDRARGERGCARRGHGAAVG